MYGKIWYREVREYRLRRVEQMHVQQKNVRGSGSTCEVFCESLCCYDVL